MAFVGLSNILRSYTMDETKLNNLMHTLATSHELCDLYCAYASDLSHIFPNDDEYEHKNIT